jgi:sugar phosphate isomerase/epimerase
MQLGFVTAILHDLPFNEVVAFASGEGFACIEPMCWPVGKAERKFAGVTHIDVATLGEREVAAIQATLQRENVFLTSLGYYPNLLSADASHAGPALAHLKQVIAAAPRLGVGPVTTCAPRRQLRGVPGAVARPHPPGRVARCPDSH